MTITNKNKFCLNCNKILGKKRSKYCSFKCSQHHRPKVCPTCKKEFRAHHMKIYCSKTCKLKSFKKSNFGNWNKPSENKTHNICTFCKINKEFEEFRKLNPPSRGWRDPKGFPRLSICKICEGERQKIKRSLKPWWRLNIMAKGRAKKNNYAYDITENDIKEIWPKDNKCPILNIEFKEGKGNRKSWPTLDKIIPTKGYIKGNIKVISFRANQLKGDVTDFEIFKKMYEFYKTKNNN